MKDVQQGQTISAAMAVALSNEQRLIMPREARMSPTHVLVVDDEPNLIELLSDALTSYGYRVSTADSGESALELSREHSFDLVLCDLYMTGMTGLQLTEALCRMHPHLPVVLITAFGDIEASRMALETGAADFITKPIELSTLPFILENNLQRKKLETQRLSEQRADVLFKAIKALAAAVDAKSHYTGRHSARMADMCIEIGKELNLPESKLNVLELAAHIHDVGKIGTPDSVLMKPGKLTDDEWVDILKHPATGASFLAGIDELAEVASVIRHHHEHLDGSGYPDGLKGDAIPFLSRILTVADSYEAMTSDRPYREAIGKNEAIKELLANSGTQFDSVVVDAMIHVINRFGEGSHEVRAA